MTDQRTHDPDRPDERHRRSSHSRMMLICCVPMLVIALALIVSGVASPRFLFGALLCAGMMVAMMAGMGHGGHR